MSKWFRSEHMEYISLIVNEDAAHDCLSDLGKLSSIQFTDLNPDLTPFQRRYVSYVRRCDELERKLRFFGNECDNFGLELHGAGDVENFLESNNINLIDVNTKELSKERLGKTITDGTYYISCLMTMAQINNMKERKVMFSDF